MANTGKTKFDRYQSLVSIAIPVLTAALAVFAYQADQKAYDADKKASELSGRIALVESSINKVEAMGEYFKMMAGENNAEAKMAAYALYMLTKEDPEMAVSIIMAAGNDELHEVLRDLGSREDAIKQEILRIAGSRDEEDNPEEVKLTEMQAGVREILGDIATSANLNGWCYLGDFENRSSLRIRLASGLPVVGESYELILDANLRADYPNKENDYGLASVTGVATKGATVTIMEIEPGDKPRVWARISVAPGK